MYGVAKRGNPGDFYGECGRAFGLRSATGSLGLTSVDGSLESSPVRPGCYLSIYLSTSWFHHDLSWSSCKVLTDKPLYSSPGPVQGSSLGSMEGSQWVLQVKEWPLAKI